ncbi:MAG TPA: CHAT domain-containing protein [Stenomitos sp.]
MMNSFSKILISTGFIFATVIYSVSGLSQNDNPYYQCTVVTNKAKIPDTLCKGDLQEFNQNNLQYVESLNHTSPGLLMQLGIALRRLGHLEISRTVLEVALKANKDSSLSSSIQLSLANLEYQLFHRNLRNYLNSQTPLQRIQNLPQSKMHLNNAFEGYRLLSENDDLNIRILALGNWLSLYSDVSNNNYFEDLEIKFSHQAFSFSNNLYTLLVTSTSIPVSLRLSSIDILISYIDQTPQLEISLYDLLYDLRKASERDLNQTVISRINGLLGKISFKQHNYIEASKYLEKAINMASLSRDAGLASNWYWMLGKSYRYLGNVPKSMLNYELSVKALDNVRMGTLAANINYQYDFLESQEPIYLEYMSVLFNENSIDISRIIKVYEKFQIAELENYLNCRNINLFSFLDLSYKDSPDAVLYLLSLENKYELVVRYKNGSFKSVSLSPAKVDTAVKDVLDNIHSDRFELLSESQFHALFLNLYDAVLKPAASILPQSGSVVFSVNSRLQQIPWGLLFDGNKFLVEKYSISYSIGSKTRPPQKLSENKMVGLLAGLSIANNEQEFSELSYVSQELDQIRSILSRSKVLMNKDFTLDNLKWNSNYPIIHLATHGQFSSDPKQTYLLGWKTKIDLLTIEKLFKGLKYPINLLVLSACETAKGDSRASLGIAGATVQSGSNSTLANLWSIDDKVQAEMIFEFYRQLSAGRSKSEALSLSQQYMMKRGYSPFYWGGAVLVGSWL